MIGDWQELALLLVVLSMAGALTGFLGGLFGIGGGAITVPVFYQLFLVLGHSEAVAMPMAVGTSLAAIIPTSLLSAQAHYKRGTVDMAVLRIWAAPIVAGVILGAVLARHAPPWLFQIVFICVALVNATKLLSGGKGWRLADSLPPAKSLRLYGGAIGLLSALMGIGGGAISTLVLTLHNHPIHRAVSTSAGVGILVALPGALGYVAAGWGKPDLPADALGFVSLATVAMTIPAAMLTTRLGVRVAHHLSRRVLECAFGCFLLLMALRFFLGILV